LAVAAAGKWSDSSAPRADPRHRRTRRGTSLAPRAASGASTPQDRAPSCKAASLDANSPHVKIYARFALMLSAVGLVAAGRQAWLSVSSAEDDLRASKARDLSVLARSLQVGFENALRDEQLEDVEETMERVQAIAPEVDIAVFDTHLNLRAGSNPDGPPRDVIAQLAGLNQPPARGSVRWLTHSDTPTLVALLPLRTDTHEPLGTMVVVDFAPDFKQSLSETREAAVWSVIVFVLGIALASLILGHVSITAPLVRLVGAMRRARLLAL